MMNWTPASVFVILLKTDLYLLFIFSLNYWLFWYTFWCCLELHKTKATQNLFSYGLNKKFPYIIRYVKVCSLIGGVIFGDLGPVVWTEEVELLKLVLERECLKRVQVCSLYFLLEVQELSMMSCLPAMRTLYPLEL